jgi:hypothetical protein
MEENKPLTNEEIDNQIKELQKLKKTIQPLSSYDARPVRAKIGYDLQPMKFLTHFIKTILVLLIIGSCIYGWGWYQGHLGKPVVIDWRGKEEFVKLNEHYLHIQKDGSMQVLDKDKKTILKEIKVKDLDNFRKYLRPYGFHLKPFVTGGGSLGATGAKGELGVGIDFFKWYRTNLNAFLTNVGAYLGLGYQITDNFDALLGVGKGYTGGDTRVYIGGKWKF